MKRFMLLIILFSIKTCLIGQVKQPNRPKIEFHSGFYLATIDSSKKHGLKLENSEKFYVINSTNYLSLQCVDTVFYKYNSNFKGYLFSIKFNTEGSKKLLDFTLKNQKKDIALLIDNKLCFVANIFEPMYNGGMDLASNFDMAKMEKIQFSITKEIKSRHRLKKPK